VLGLLGEQAANQPWWLGYLDTGADDIVFPDAPKVTMYAGWHYVVVEAGPQQAATWRDPGSFFTGVLPNLMFPGDRSWLVSTLWDDDWTCIGGPAELVKSSCANPVCKAGPWSWARTPHRPVTRRWIRCACRKARSVRSWPSGPLGGSGPGRGFSQQ